jgi:AraC-like DNA-binding protein
VSLLDLPPSKELLRQEYVGRVNRVIDYIEENIDTELTLETLAKVASFSRFHFHRIFSALVGETLNHPPTILMSETSIPRGGSR